MNFDLFFISTEKLNINLKKSHDIQSAPAGRQRIKTKGEYREYWLEDMNSFFSRKTL